METIEIIQHLLPKEFAEYFELIDMKEEDNQLFINLDEKNIPPSEHANIKLQSKGFF